VRDFAWSLELSSTKTKIREFDFTRPSPLLEAASSAFEQGHPPMEVYLHSGTALPSNLKHRAQTAAEARAARQKRGHGTGLVTGFTAGQTFELAGHGVGDLDQKYILLRVEHVGEAHESMGGGAGDLLGREYSNQFECQPVSQPFRPPLTVPRPRIAGMETAIVVGAGGEEIHTDATGRIKVQFHWDRLGKSDDKSSCWIRVAQNWGGAGWGFSFVPRVGMEVLVAFLDGDPDRPMVVGCVNNGALPTVYDLPGSKTKSGIRTNSSPGGGGFNELTFEDAAGGEQIFMQAQKDLQITVKAAKSQSVGATETLSVGSDRSRTIGGNQTLTVTGNDDNTINASQTHTIAANRTETIGGNQTESVGGSRSETVGGSHTETVAIAFALTVGAAANIAVGGAMSEEVGGLKNETIGAAKTEQVGGVRSLMVGGSSSEKIGGGFSITAGGAWAGKSGGKWGINSGADMLLDSSAGMALKATGELTLHAKKIGITAEDELTITVGSAKICMKSNGDITIKGNKVAVEGSDVKIKGSKIAEN
jgi:type VI secretion system secreted protein VgrG